MKTREFLRSWQLNAPASEQAIRDAELSLNCSLPLDYIQFLRDQNGGEGFIGNHYLIIWKVEELASHNAAYEVSKYAPGLILFASSGGGAGYAFDTREVSMPIVSTEFIGMSLDELDRTAATFDEFLGRFADHNGQPGI